MAAVPDDREVLDRGRVAAEAGPLAAALLGTGSSPWLGVSLDRTSRSRPWRCHYPAQGTARPAAYFANELEAAAWSFVQHHTALLPQLLALQLTYEPLRAVQRYARLLAAPLQAAQRAAPPQQHPAQHPQPQQRGTGPLVLQLLLDATLLPAEPARDPPPPPDEPPQLTAQQDMARRLVLHRRRALTVLATLAADQLLPDSVLLPVQTHCLLGLSLAAACALYDALAAAAGLPGWRQGHLDHVLPLALTCAQTQLGKALTLRNLRPLLAAVNMAIGSRGKSRVQGRTAAGLPPLLRNLPGGQLAGLAESQQVIAAAEEEAQQHEAVLEAELQRRGHDPAACSCGPCRLVAAPDQPFVSQAQADEVLQQQFGALWICAGAVGRIMAAEREPDYMQPWAMSAYLRHGATGCSELYLPLVPPTDGYGAGMGAQLADEVAQRAVRRYMQLAERQRLAADLAPLPEAEAAAAEAALRGHLRRALMARRRGEEAEERELDPAEEAAELAWAAEWEGDEAAAAEAAAAAAAAAQPAAVAAAAAEVAAQPAAEAAVAAAVQPQAPPQTPEAAEQERQQQVREQAVQQLQQRRAAQQAQAEQQAEQQGGFRPPTMRQPQQQAQQQQPQQPPQQAQQRLAGMDGMESFLSGLSGLPYFSPFSCINMSGTCATSRILQTRWMGCSTVTVERKCKRRHGSPRCMMGPCTAYCGADRFVRGRPHAPATGETLQQPLAQQAAEHGRQLFCLLRYIGFAPCCEPSAVLPQGLLEETPLPAERCVGFTQVDAASFRPALLPRVLSKVDAIIARDESLAESIEEYRKEFRDAQGITPQQLRQSVELPPDSEKGRAARAARAAAPRTLTFCKHCKQSAEEAGVQELLRCARCKIERYCSRDCQAPVTTPFLDNLLGGKPQLTKKQANMVAGAWNMTSHVRLDGPIVDKQLIAAFNATAGDLQTADAQAAIEDALVSSTVRSVFWVPGVDTKTGMFAGYTLLSLPGVALGQADGSVLLQAAGSEDTGIATSVVKGDRLVRLWLEGLEVVKRNTTDYQDGITAQHYTGHPEILDNQAVGVLEYEKLPESEAKAVAEQVVKEVEKWWA
ncbi:hypothetical protein C2E21_5042 isoform A [Chlorella sorokiniana]|uniref:MYND-type domain-containing protein n=1 Tax=Chlorella sorokiniana TaxID=3076 RepID=A0A2P6TQ62_CHLSO|nr:hypothetical protein C2E21_5042 isoform A [Chlorella sorokiniana]|eukprot:PRW56170.1 hypothetical protein C2E21_5042 isoform A [Chlorella sorokiniana]